MLESNDFTSYDEIFSMFMQNCKVDDIELPQTDQGKYDMIRNAVFHFNNRMGDNIKLDDTLEKVNRKLSNNHLLLIIHYIRLSFLKNQLTQFSLTWQPFQKDIGLKNFSHQIRALTILIEDQERFIEQIILSQQQDIL